MDATFTYRLVHACDGGDHLTIAATVNGVERARFEVLGEEARNFSPNEADLAKDLFLLKLKGLTRQQTRALVTNGFSVAV